MKNSILAIFLVVIVVGCASSSQKIEQQHQLKAQELDKQYKSGQIDAAQYQVKYLEESLNYGEIKKEPSTFRKIMSFLWDAHMQKKYG